MEQNPVVKHPFGEATIVQLAATGTDDIDIQNDLTVLDGATVQATGARTVNLNIAPDLNVGARLVILHKTAATETLTPGTGMKGKAITGVAGKTFAAEYFYTGTEFVQLATAIQID